MLGTIIFTLYFAAVAVLFGYMIWKDFFDRDWVSLVGHLLLCHSVCSIGGDQVDVGAFQMISLIVGGAIVLVIIIYMAIVSHYI